RLSRAMQRRFETAAQRLDRAAARLTHPRQRIEQARLRLGNLEQRLQARIQRQLAASQARTTALGLRLTARRPDLAARKRTVDTLAARLERAGRSLIQRQQDRLDALGQHLSHLDPKGVLARGYSITRDADGAIVRDAASLEPGSRIRVEFHVGEVDATVNSKKG
ncbi:exodeoxyribonuclease VII large subunit, partial [Zoogloea oryzae]|uniref:exodeoxyribonuclease VII large subunit n=1 Tax=Zoogloea oryzae TaxID=310767 RepID=UPI0024E087A6